MPDWCDLLGRHLDSDRVQRWILLWISGAVKPIWIVRGFVLLPLWKFICLSSCLHHLQLLPGRFSATNKLHPRRLLRLEQSIGRKRAVFGRILLQRWLKHGFAIRLRSG